MNRDTRSAKGQGTVLLISIGVLAAFLGGIVAFNQASVIPDLFEQRTNDLSTLAKTETNAENVEEMYTPLAAKYSLHEATHNITEMREWCVGIDACNGGKDFVNTPVDSDFPDCLFEMYSDDYNFRGNKSNGDSSEFKYHYNFYMDCVDEVAKGYYSDYSDSLDYGECEVNIRDNSVKWNRETGKMEVESDTGEGLVSAECDDGENEMNYTSNEDFLERDIKKNNYDSMMLALYKITREMENVTEDIEENDNYYGVASDTKSCRVNTSDLKSQAESDARSDGLDKIDQVRVAIVEKAHGIGSGSDRGGVYIYRDITGKTDIPILNYIVDYLVRNIDADISNVNSGWYDGGNYNTELESSSASSCGCYEKTCDETYFDYSGSNYVCGASGSCEYNDGNPDPECQTGYNHDGDGNCNDIDRDPCQTSGFSLEDPLVGSAYCENDTDSTDTYSPPTCGSGYTFDDSDNSCEDDSITPDCDDENGIDFEPDGSGSCEVKNPPSPECERFCWEAEADVRWWVSWMEVYMNITDDEDGEIPTSDGWIQLEWNEKYDRPIEDAPWE